MGAPRNSIPMLGGEGPSGAIDMGGMFTIVKVREGLSSYADPGWYTYPPGTRAHKLEGQQSAGPIPGFRALFSYEAGAIGAPLQVRPRPKEVPP